MNTPGTGPPEGGREEATAQGGGADDRSATQLRNSSLTFLSIRSSRLLIVGLVVFAILFSALGASYGQVPWGTSVGGVSLGGLSPQKARDRFTRRAEAFLSRAIRIEIATSQGVLAREIAPRELGFGIDVSETLAQVTPISLPLFRTWAFIGRELPSAVTLNAERFKIETAELFQSIETKPGDAAVRIREDDPTEGEIVPGKSGTRVDRGALFSELVLRIEKASDKPVAVSLYEAPPRTTAKDLEESLGAWRRFIRSGSLRLTLEEASWEVASTTFAKWIEFNPEADDVRESVHIGLNHERAAPFFISLASAVEKPALNALIDMQDGVLEEVAPPRKGHRLLVAESIKSAERAVRGARHDAQLVTETQEPAITLSKVRELGITGVVGEGESSFAGSPNNRIHNIKTGAARFRSVLIGAGREFSFNALLGEVDGAHGYLPELVIKKNKTVPEYGGGLCQISTTVFRAAVAAGVPITERQNHSFIVSYYGKPGFDATIYPGSRDFRFKNDTPGPLILQMKSEGTKLFAELFGISDGRVVEIQGPVVYESNPDGSARALLTRAIERAGARHEEKFYSFYKPKALYPVERNPYE